jgi:aspartate aminotransferase
MELKDRILSDRIKEMPISATIKAAQMARDLKAKGFDIIDMSLGEPDFDTPDFIKEAAKKALDEGHTKYTPVPGTVELRKAIQHKLKRDNGLDYGLDEIVVSNGAKQTFANICLTTLNRGEEVILFTPYWVSYHSIIEMAGGIPVEVKAGIEQDFKVTAQQVKDAITGKTKIVLFSSPCNPTGSVYSRDELEAIAMVLKDHPEILIISDEIYEYINFTDHHASIASFEYLRDHVVIINGMSKGFAMTGWRLGYLAGPEWLARSCEKIQGQFTSGANSFGQIAAAQGLLQGPDPKMREAFRMRKELFRNLLDEIPGFKVNNPEGAFYIFPDISSYFGSKNGKYKIDDSHDFVEVMLNEANVSCVPGEAFGAPNCVRFSYATSEDKITEVARRIKHVLSKFNK